MQIRSAGSPESVIGMTTEQLRSEYLVEGLTGSAQVQLAYTHHDRLVVGGVTPGAATVALPTPPELRSQSFLDRRELGVVNIGEAGVVTVGGEQFELGPREVLYVGRGAGEVTFSGEGAVFYLVSTRAHSSHPTTRITQEQAEPVRLGGQEGSNDRTIYKYIHAGGAASCELVLGITVLEPGSMWNTMPAHVHDRRTEVYFYFGLPEGGRVVHLMGEPTETRHVLVADREAVISPPWSVHCGFGTGSYAFVWAMGGENQEYTDVEVVPVEQLR
jgi:4-deoxy-L-threo-5-hexosulose-uronate ketol-isomerase